MGNLFKRLEGICRDAGRRLNRTRSTRRTRTTRKRISTFETFEPRRVLTGSSVPGLNTSNDDQIANAASLGTLSSSRPAVYVDDGVGSNVDRTFDPIDHYRFAITSTTSVRLNLSRHEGTVNIRLLDIVGRPVAYRHVLTNDVDNLLAANLSPGRYVIELTKREPVALGHLAYSLAVTLTTSNDLPTAPTDLGRLAEELTPTVRLEASVGGTSDVQDYVKFTLLQTKTIRYSVSEMSSDVDIQLLRQSGHVMSGARSSHLLVTNMAYDNLPSGTYLLRIRPTNPARTTNYVLNITCSRGSDDVFGQASHLGILTSARPTVHVSDAVGLDHDIQDYYRINISSVSTLRVNLSGMSHDMQIQIMDRYGRSMIQQSLNEGTVLENITIPNIPVDFYYVRAFLRDRMHISSYELTFSITGGDDMISDAQPIPTDTAHPTAVVHGTLTGAGDIQDYYKFTVTEYSPIMIVLSGLSFNADLHWTEENGSILAVGANPLSLMERIGSYGVPAGNYLIKVFSRGTTAYDLTVRLGTNWDDTLNDPVSLGTLNAARPRATGSSELGASDIQDYYVLYWSDRADLELTVRGLTPGAANVQVELLNAFGVVIASSINPDTDTESVSISGLLEGRYYIRVYTASFVLSNRYDLVALRL